MTEQYLTAAETAALVRKALKEAFPGVKFGVRSRTYAGGASIDVKWADGPATKQVNAIVERFQGSYFDGMTDYKGSITSMMGGQLVRFGADFIFTSRNYSDALLQRAIDAVAGKYRLSNPPTVAQFRAGLLGQSEEGFDVGMLITNDLSKRTTMLAAESPTAAGVFYLADDGYRGSPLAGQFAGEPT